MTIELVKPFLDIKSPNFGKLVSTLRIEMLKELAKSNLKGVIFTCGWVLNDPESNKFIDKIVKLFKKVKSEIYYVELETNLEERLKRNNTPNRLKHKPSKRDLKSSKSKIIEFDKTCQFNTNENEFHRKNHLKINNTAVSAKKVAMMIKDTFKF